jgi:NifB/MoaA-like Fe-S oxidoreductase
MKGPAREALLYQAARRGILPLTSRCNAACIFCSHRYNPPGVEVLELGVRPWEEVRASLDWLDGSDKIVVGESVTRIKEGEPLTYPHLLPVLELVRARFPASRISLTTNGSWLGPPVASALAGLGVELVFSLNSADPVRRARLMGDPLAPAGIAAVSLASRLGIAFEGSLVALPQLVGYEDIAGTIRFLAREGATCIRVMEPGFTRLTPAELVPPPGTRRRLDELAEAVATATGVAVMVEPPHPRDLRPVVAGVMANSPAQGAGMGPGDVLSSIDGRVPFSRVDAFVRLKAARNPRVVVEGRGELILEKDAGRSPGAIFSWDVSQADVDAIASAVTGAKKPLVITSPLGETALSLALARAGIDASVRAVSCTFFGGSIACAGLLTVQDVIDAFHLQPPPAGTDLLALPPLAFDPWQRDLTGVSSRVLEKATGISCVVPRGAGGKE